MNSFEVTPVAALIIFTINALLMAGLVALKAVHRSRDTRGRQRRSRYMELVSRHISYQHCTDPITSRMASDPVFIDALIDVRNALSGQESETLRGIVDRHGVTERQVARLRSSFPLGRRLRAAVVLAELGDESAVDALMEHLGDREPEIRIQAARGLGRMRWTPAIDAVVDRFNIETPWVRSRFADTLVNFGTEATWPLLAYIRVNHTFESDGPVAAIRTLGAIGDDQVVQPLIGILHDATDVEVKLAAIETLGALASPSAGPVLRVTARSADWRVRAKSMTALAEIGDTGSLDLLAGALADREWWVRRNAAAALIRVPGGIDRLYEALVGDDRFAGDAAAEALADAGELSAARQRAGTGEGRSRDFALIGHMAGGS
jgi:hypothetical protein